ncbi:MAG: SDR family NAD(P)-dependent oxidoreductase [Candidatus Bathyarchaeia archaeon]
MRRALVTGGAGFIGSHLVDRLLELGWNVTVLDDFSSGREINLSKAKGNSKLHVIRGSILETKRVSEAFENVDTVFHEAALASVQRSMEDPVAVYRVNLEGTIGLLEESRRHDVRRFVYASSCGVYGNASVLPILETSPLQPINPYAASKAASEQFCTAYQNTYGLESICLRYSNVYGPRRSTGPYSGVFVRFAECITKNQPLPIVGDGMQTRDFIHVSDVVEANVRSAQCDGISGRIINIGTCLETSITKLAQLMLNAADKSQLGTVRIDSRPGEIVRSQVSTALARKFLGFENRVELSKGITNFLDWYQGNCNEDMHK